MKGIIYKISGYGLNYYGSTIQPLCERKACHIGKYHNRDKGYPFCTSWIIFEQGDDWTIEQLEELEFDDLDILRDKESVYQKNNECVNKHKKKTEEEMKKYKADWATSKRRESGMKIKTEMTKTKQPGYKAEWARQKRANMTPEEREAINARKRELRREH